MRCPLLLPSQLSAEQEPLYADMMEGIGADFKPVFETSTPEGQLIGPWSVWLQQPATGRVVWDLVKVMTAQATLDPAVREISILVVGAHFHAGYEIYAHGALAKAGGMSDERLSCILSGSRPSDMLEQESCSFDIAKALTRGGILPDALYKRAIDVLGQQGTSELINLVALYHLVAVILNGFNVAVPTSL
jgi:4-carboxymuconolactone decarboxylase